MTDPDKLKDLSGAALIIVEKKLGSYVQITCRSEACPPDRLENRQLQITQFFDWARTLSNSCERSAYLSWERLYQSHLDEQKEEARTHADRDHMAEYTRRTHEEVARWHDKAPLLTQPPR